METLQTKLNMTNFNRVIQKPVIQQIFFLLKNIVFNNFQTPHFVDENYLFMNSGMYSV